MSLCGLPPLKSLDIKHQDKKERYFTSSPSNVGRDEARFPASAKHLSFPHCYYTTLILEQTIVSCCLQSLRSCRPTLKSIPMQVGTSLRFPASAKHKSFPLNRLHTKSKHSLTLLFQKYTQSWHRGGAKKLAFFCLAKAGILGSLSLLS